MEPSSPSFVPAQPTLKRCNASYDVSHLVSGYGEALTLRDFQVAIYPDYVDISAIWCPQCRDTFLYYRVDEWCPEHGKPTVIHMFCTDRPVTHPGDIILLADCKMCNPDTHY